MFAKYRDLGNDMALLRNSLAEQRQTARASQEQLSTSQKRMKDLEDCERQLRPWKERESKIMYYLGVFKEVMQ